MRNGRRAGVVLFLVAMQVFSATSAEARSPEVRNVNLRGLQIGAVTVLTIDGVDLLPEPRIYLNDKLLTGTLDPASTAARVIVSVPVPETVLSGFAQLRVATAEGFSNSMLVGLDRLPQLPIAEETAAVPVALNGSVPGSG
ncbi:MAG: hypothetical protein JWM11_2477, partial [Planctomycetaceae bacterium]|nr:hypothetical protein [Planctomycetaceae bacterium]